MLKVLNQLAIMFKVSPNDIIEMNGRKEELVAARRFYVYYLNKHKNIPHNQIKKYIKGMCHATSIYHCRKLEDYFKIYEDVKVEYIEMLYQADETEFYNLRNNIIFKDVMKNILTIIK